MSAYDPFPEIDESIRTFLLDYDDISDLVGTRVFYYRVPLIKGKEPDVPLIVFNRAGGVYGRYRYFFRVRAKDMATLALLRRAVIRRLHSPMNLPTGENITEVTIEGQFGDTSDETLGWFESSMYVNIEIMEAQYI